MTVKYFHTLILAATFIIGSIATYFAYSFSENLATNDAKQRFNKAAMTRTSEIKEKLQDSQDVLLALKAFIDSSDDITRSDFSKFSTVLTNHHPQLSTIAWLDTVSLTDSKLDKNSSLHYRIRYSHSNNNGDFNALLVNNKSLTLNQKLNSISMTVLETRHGNNSVLFSLPLFPKSELDLSGTTPNGFLVMVVDLSELVLEAIKVLPVEPIVISIKNNAQELTVLGTAKISIGKQSNSQLKSSEIINIADNSFEVSSLSKVSLFYHHTYLGQLTLTLGIIITLLLSYIVFKTIKRHSHIVGLVEKKTGELEHANVLILEQEKHIQSKEKKHRRFDEIKYALLNDELCLYYQPKVNMRTGDVFGVEALIRWIHPEKGLIPPLDFLPLIDGTDLECQIGDWVINQALSQLSNWQQQGIKLEVSVNISSHHLQTDSFFSQLDKALAQHPSVNSKSLQLEILESGALGDYKAIQKIIQNCQNILGINMALDDFGTGYSSLSHLRNLPVNTIKIDQSFIRDMIDDPSDYAIVDGVIGLADSFNREVIAEGVETTAHGLILLISGCECAQGYGIAKPMPASDFSDWVTHYSPNKEWLLCANEKITAKARKEKLFRIIIQQWKDKVIEKIHSSPDDIKHWPIMEHKHSHCSDWLKRTQQTQLFDPNWLGHLEKDHEKLHILANDLYRKYEQGNIDSAKAGLAGFYIILDDINNILELEHSIKTIAPSNKY